MFGSLESGITGSQKEPVWNPLLQSAALVWTEHLEVVVKYLTYTSTI